MKAGRAREIAEELHKWFYEHPEEGEEPNAVLRIESAIQAAVGEALEDAQQCVFAWGLSRGPVQDLIDAMEHLKKRWASKGEVSE